MFEIGVEEMGSLECPAFGREIDVLLVNGFERGNFPRCKLPTPLCRESQAIR